MTNDANEPIEKKIIKTGKQMVDDIGCPDEEYHHVKYFNEKKASEGTWKLLSVFSFVLVIIGILVMMGVIDYMNSATSHIATLERWKINVSSNMDGFKPYCLNWNQTQMIGNIPPSNITDALYIFNVNCTKSTMISTSSYNEPVPTCFEYSWTEVYCTAKALMWIRNMVLGESDSKEKKNL